MSVAPYTGSVDLNIANNGFFLLFTVAPYTGSVD